MRHHSALFATCILTCASLATPAYADGKLSRARKEASGSSSSSGSNSSSSDSSRSSDSASSHSHYRRPHHHHYREEPPSTYIASEVAIVGWTGQPETTYSSYPYATSRSPYLLEPELQVASTSASLDAHLRAEHSAGQPWAGQLSLDAGFFAGVGQSNLNLRVLMPGPFELSARNTMLWEPAQSDYSLFGAAVIGLRIAQSRVALLRLFGGIAYFGQLRELLPGTEFGISMEVFLGRPWVLSAGASATFVGPDGLFAPQARVQLGYLFGRSEVFVAYQYLQIGSVDLSAPVLGTRIWL